VDPQLLLLPDEAERDWRPSPRGRLPWRRLPRSCAGGPRATATAPAQQPSSGPWRPTFPR